MFFFLQVGLDIQQNQFASVTITHVKDLFLKLYEIKPELNPNRKRCFWRCRTQQLEELESTLKMFSPIQLHHHNKLVCISPFCILQTAESEESVSRYNNRRVIAQERELTLTTCTKTKMCLSNTRPWHRGVTRSRHHDVI